MAGSHLLHVRELLRFCQARLILISESVAAAAAIVAKAVAVTPLCFKRLYSGLNPEQMVQPVLADQ